MYKRLGFFFISVLLLANLISGWWFNKTCLGSTMVLNPTDVPSTMTTVSGDVETQLETTPTASPETSLVIDNQGRKWQVIWQDEFNDTSIDLSKWDYDTGGDGFGNDELQYYTDRSDNSYVEDGNLVIAAREESYRDHDYTSAKLRTKYSMNIQYGRIDIRARLPQGKGLWPAFWMLSTESDYGEWPASGEIDIMELLGHQPSIVYGTLHYTANKSDSHHESGDQYQLNQGTFADDFHTFSLVWEKDRFEWYVDDEMYQAQTEWKSAGYDYPAPFDKRFYLIMNLAVGGEWPGSPNSSTQFPQKLVIDYVRVYQQQDS